MNLYFIPFEPCHFGLVQDVDENARKEAEGVDLLANAEKLKKAGPTRTLMDGQEAIACCGLLMISKTVAEVWVRMSKKVGPRAAKMLRDLMYDQIEEHHLLRAQAIGPVSWVKLPAWWSWIGMQCEGVLRKYGPNGEDYFMYSWVKE